MVFNIHDVQCESCKGTPGIITGKRISEWCQGTVDNYWDNVLFTCTDCKYTCNLLPHIAPKSSMCRHCYHECCFYCIV